MMLLTFQVDCEPWQVQGVKEDIAMLLERRGGVRLVEAREVAAAAPEQLRFFGTCTRQNAGGDGFMRTVDDALFRSKTEAGCEHCRIYSNNGKYLREHPESAMRFCWNCGRPLTEVAVAELERRINGGTTD